MSHQIRSQLKEFLTRSTYPNIREDGIWLAENGRVLETYREGSRIVGVVGDKLRDSTFSASLIFASSGDIEKRCDCPELAQGTWCAHTVALFWAAADLGMFDERAGFAAQESILKPLSSSPSQVAKTIESLLQAPLESSALQLLKPSVEIILSLVDDRLGVRVLWDGILKGVGYFSHSHSRSARALDNLFLEILESVASWDEERNFWYISVSDDILKILGLIREYNGAKISALAKRDYNTNNVEDEESESFATVELANYPLEAELSIEWNQDGALVSMAWCYPDGTKRARTEALVGTGPYWIYDGKTIYKLSVQSGLIASIFKDGSELTFRRSELGPLLEVLSRIDSNKSDQNSKYLKILNPKLQPQCKRIEPEIKLTLRRSDSNNIGSADISVGIHAQLEFEYASPNNKDNIVYLPNPTLEIEALREVETLGFKVLPYNQSSGVSQSKKLMLEGESALDLLSQITQEKRSPFPSHWKIDGLEQLKLSVKFAELKLNVEITRPSKDSQSDEGIAEIDWFDCTVSLVQNNARVPVSLLFKKPLREHSRWMALDSGAFAKVPSGDLGQLNAMLGLLDPNYRLSNAIRTKISRAQAISLSRVDDRHTNFSSDSALEQLKLAMAKFERIKRQRPPKHFKGDLRPYQEEGLGWLHFLERFSFGGILADEMGLGKTIQALSFLCAIKAKRKKTEPSLIIVPTSIVTNWQREAERFTPELKVMVLQGSERKRLFEKIPEHDLVITSYALLRIDIAELEGYRFNYVILDEAQYIKNFEAATSRSAKLLRSRGRLAMTGTPTENRPMELWSIFDFLMPGFLGSSDFFRRQIERPILEGSLGAEMTRFLASRTKAFILRRTKSEVARDLPPKIESVIPVTMLQSQKELYSQILAEVRPSVFQAVEKKGVKGATVSILAALLRLRQVCNHPNSISGLREVEGFESGKFEALKELLTEALASGRKILLYSQFLEMLSIIRTWLDSEKISHLYLDGATKNRQELVDQFNNNPEIKLFAISLKAGGLGLNLTGADTVIIYDPWWNPAVEHQAADRAHRIGQKKTVTVYRLVTEDSVEAKIMELKRKKSKLIDALVNDNALSPLKLSKGDLEELFAPLR